MKKTAIISLLTIVLLNTSCLRLDDLLHNNNINPITEYKLGDYEGEIAFTLPDSMKIEQDKIHLFQILSDFDGVAKNIYALYLGDTARIAIDTVILYCHGNWDHLDYYYPCIQLLANAGGKHNYGVMSFDYRGYGLSEGYPTESFLYADTDAAMKWLKSKGLTNDRLVIYGFSMGTAPATELTANTRSMTPSKLILEAPFASGETLVQDATGLALPGSYIIDLKIDNAQEIQKVTQPFLWFHGTDDKKIRIETHGEVVYKNYGGTVSYACRVPGAGHSDIPVVLGYDHYLNIIDNFIKGNLTYSGLITED
ncbi:MAG: alpha/beta hydrolase [Bacteroidales bacterium]|nr:alpha/beta hydrolase [Bacteroidales bacterium]